MLVPIAALAFAGCGNNGAGTQAAGGHAGDGAVRDISGNIAYVNMDSLLNRYEMYVELSTALEAKASKAENEVKAKGRSLERSMADAQEKVDKGLVTRAQAAELQEKLVRQEQNFYAYRDRMQQELAEENAVMVNNVMYALNKFLEEFNKDYRYAMILTTSGGAPVLHADPSLDITEEVAKGLNDAYAKEKKGGKGETAPEQTELPSTE